MGMRKITFKADILVEPDEGRFHACRPALKGVHVDGDTEEEAIQNAKDAILAYLDSLVKHNEPIPLSMTMEEVACRVGRDGKPTPGQHMQSVQVQYAQA